MTGQRYAEGGYIGGVDLIAWIHPEECYLRPDEHGRVTCVRRQHDHTTPPAVPEPFAGLVPLAGPRRYAPLPPPR